MSAGQDRPVARERRAVLARERVLAGLEEAERIDPERADDARVQAPEVEREDVAVEARARSRARARRGSPTTSTSRADVGRDEALAVEARQVEVIERGDRAPLAVHREPREARALHREADEIGVRRRCRARGGSLRGCRRRARPRPRRACGGSRRRGRRPCGDLLPAPEELVRHVLEREALEAVRRRLERRDAVEHDAPGHARDRRPAAPTRSTRTRALSPARPIANGTPMLAAARLEDREIELDDVPADEDVGVDRADRREERDEERPLVAART